MKLTRRRFFGGIIASVAAACLPKTKASPTPPAAPQQWTMLIYGAPIIYYPRNFHTIMEENI